MLRHKPVLLSILTAVLCLHTSKDMFGADPPGAIDPSSWMESISDHIRNKSLREIAIPGAHDAATAAISSHSEFAPISELPIGDIARRAGDVVAEWSRAQPLSLSEQLNAGVRYFDLRVAKRPADGRCYFVHTMFGGDVASQMRKFPLSFPSIQKRSLSWIFRIFPTCPLLIIKI